MRVGRLLFGSAAAIAVFGVAHASAADFGGTASSLPPIVGYIEAHGGGDSGYSTHYDPSADGAGTWSDYIFGGSGHVGIVVYPSFSVQGDVWSDTFVATDDSGTGTDSGIGGHVTWRSPDGAMMFGLLGSVGHGGSDDGVVDNFGAEAVLSGDSWRLYGQAGVTSGVSGDAASSGERDTYATVSADYFLTPNFVVSANIGGDNWTQSNGDSSPELSWGARVEFKPDASPVSFFVAYQGLGFRSNYHDQSAYDQGAIGEVLAGIKVPFGATTLQDTQRAAGLADLNPSFGDLVNR